MIKFRLFGIDFKIAYSSVLLLTFAAVTSVKADTLLLFLLFSFMHELGHLVPMLLYCGKPESVSLSFGEANIRCDMSKLSVSREILISSGGVIVNFSLCLIFYLLYIFVRLQLFCDASLVNLIIGVFNILPVRSLDGEAVLSLMLGRSFSPRTVDTVINILSVIILIPIAILGFLSLFTSAYNYSLLFVFIYFISIIIIKEMR